jgi:hypothetical protein
MEDLFMSPVAMEQFLFTAGNLQTSYPCHFFCKKDTPMGIRSSIITEHSSRSAVLKERISRLPRSTTMPAKESVSSHYGLASLVTPLGNTLVEVSAPGHTALE